MPAALRDDEILPPNTDDPGNRPDNENSREYATKYTAMAGKKRGVRFPHRNAANGQAGTDGRRSSFSDASEEGSGSPTRRRAQAQLESVNEVF